MTATQPMERRKRRTRQPRLNANGEEKPFFFTANDREICRLLAPGLDTRRPFTYYYLPTSYIFTLLTRDPSTVRRRLRDLFDEEFLERQGVKNLYRDELYSLAKRGADKLQDEGEFKHYRARRLTHELLACIIGASLEFGARRHRLEIERADNHTDILPDWPVFTIGGCTFFVEADMDTESLVSKNKEATTIADKFQQYLTAIDSKKIRRARVLFVTISPSRKRACIELLKKVIDKKGYDHSIAQHFCFASLNYDRDLITIPKLTDWAVTYQYERAGYGPFCIKEMAA